jgi:hypothetical protein
MPVSKPLVELSPDDVTADPQALNPGHDDGTGSWGLPIVVALSYQCGVKATPPQGKWVWSRILCCAREAGQSRATARLID